MGQGTTGLEACKNDNRISLEFKSVVAMEFLGQTCLHPASFMTRGGSDLKRPFALRGCFPTHLRVEVRKIAYEGARTIDALSFVADFSFTPAYAHRLRLVLRTR